MNEFQEKFLHELSKLCDKYNIDSIAFESGRIRFNSNGQSLGFQRMELDRYIDIETRNDCYEVKANG